MYYLMKTTLYFMENNFTLTKQNKGLVVMKMRYKMI